MLGLVDGLFAVYAAAGIELVVACFAGIQNAVAAVRSSGAVGLAAVVSAVVVGFSEIALFVILSLAVAAVWRCTHTTGHTFAFAIRCVVDAIVADFAGKRRDNAVTAGRSLALGRAVGAAIVVIVATEIAFFAVRNDAIAAIPLAGVFVARRRIGAGRHITIFVGVDFSVAAQRIFVFAL